MLMIFVFPVPAMVTWLVFIAMILVALLSLCALFAVASTVLATVLVSFSKISFALVVALVCSQYSLFGLSDTTNYALWAAITLTITFLLCKMPRISRAIKFASTFLLSYAAVEILVFAIMSFVFMFFGEKFEITMAQEIVIRVLCTIVSLFALTKEIVEELPANGEKKENVLWANIQRLVASAVYSVPLTVIYVSGIGGVWTVSKTVFWCLLISFAGGAFLADIILPKTTLMDAVRGIYRKLSKEPEDPAQKRKEMINALK